MANTALTIARNAAAVIGVDDFTNLVGNNQPGPRAMLKLLDRSGIALSRMRNSWGASWAVLTVEWEFETVPGVQEYAFPDDYEALLDDTLWDRDTYREARGVLSPQEWQALRSGLVQTVALAPYYRISRGSVPSRKSLYLEPVPEDRRRLVLEYLSNGWVIGPDQGLRKRITTDNDETILDDEILELALLWRFKQANGLAFATELAEYEMEVRRRFAEDAGTRTITLGDTGYRQWPNIAETGFGGVGA